MTFTHEGKNANKANYQIPLTAASEKLHLMTKERLPGGRNVTEEELGPPTGPGVVEVDWVCSRQVERLVALRQETQPVDLQGVVHLLDDVRVVRGQVEPLARVSVQVEETGVGPAVRHEVVHLPHVPATDGGLASKILH